MLREERAHETRPKLCEREETLVSASRACMPGMPSQAATGDDADKANGDHAARGDQTDPRGLPLPRPAVRRSPADLPQRRGGCLGAVRDDLWAGCRLAGGTAASLAASDCG